MATPITGVQTTGSDSVIAGYFDSGENAHRAINALLDEGFLPSQIGAAFHSGSGASGATASGHEDEEVDTTLRGIHTSIATGSAHTGPSSDTTAVQPNILGAGSGTPFDGAGRPGPIPGGDLVHTGLPSELEHELPNAPTGGGSAGTYAATPTPASYATSAATPAHTHTGSWASKVKHLFEPKHDSSANKPVTEATRQDFGTGEGQLDLLHRHVYSAGSLESSATSAGVPAEHSRHLSRRLARGGAIVTVSVTGRAIEVERIFEAHHGLVRFEGATFDDADTESTGSSVEVFGHLHHHYRP